MARLFEGYKFTGKILPFESFRPFLDKKQDLTKAWSDERKNSCIKQAESYLQEKIPSLPATLYAQFRRNGNRSLYETPYFERRVMAISLACAEAIENKGRFTDKLMDVVWAILEETTWVVPAHNNGGEQLFNQYKETVKDIDLFSAETGSCLAWVYYLCKDKLDKESPVICKRIYYEINRRLLTPFVTYEYAWAVIYINNWVPWIVSNILIAAAFVERDIDKREKIVSHALPILDNFTNTYGEDGGCEEGPNYWARAGAAYFDCLEALYDMSGGEIDIFSKPLIKAMFEYIIKVNIDDCYYVSFADGKGRVNHENGMIARMGEKVGSMPLRQFGQTRINRQYKDYLNKLKSGDNKNEKLFVSSYSIYRSIKEGYEHPDLHQKDTTIHLPLVSWLADLQILITRQYTESDKGLFLAIRGGHNAESHSHNDVGNFIVYYKGKPVFLDSGSGEYTAKTFSPNRYDIWTMQSSYHNLPEINGYMQKNGKEYKAENVIFNEADNSLSMDISKAYDKSAGVHKWTRTGLLDAEKVTISDNFELEQESDIRLNYLVHTRPEISQGKMTFENGITACFDLSLTAQIEEIELDNKLKDSWQTDKLYRVILSGKGKSGSNIMTIQ